MQERLKRVLKKGTWLYAGTAAGHVQIVMSNYFWREPPYDEDSDPNYPPRDDNGNFYYVEYWFEVAVPACRIVLGRQRKRFDVRMK